ncbi:MAG: hypothetical protein M1826_005729 [Phylliscum demangeonii]|nr:MAG: hypothetical protein M1826_005729 [Phylliscum demangeonii]
MAGGKRPTLLRDSTSYMESPDDFNGLDYTDDEFAEGEEYMERLMMEEQLRLEAVDDGLEDEIESARPAISSPSTPDLLASGEQLCPMCGAGLGGMADHDVQVHVNSCLDERKIPVPQDKEPLSKLPGDLNPSNRIQRPPKPAKPGQASPFALGQAAGVSSSAFTKLMSSHAEDAAWATAAAAEQAARGKPAFQRTCPFYKILPGLSICVDAFRYGAVEGCRAYFLSHFHSDHYIGLTSSWAHGPIYCSRITANLVKQQLRVDPNFVVDLEFEEKSEVPETNGVQVTMISANHCPGSSLFLFEKVIGRGKTPKTQRILHCGDFRACPAHIHHALLRPTVLDPSTGKCVGQQKIDVCYLDTTYLNPRYAFPSQEKVVGACADMCVSLRNEFLDQNDEWEKVKQRRAGSGMTKFVQVGAEDGVSPASHDPVDAMQVNTRTNGRSRGRLLVVVGTYSIGKERICLGIARALDCKIFAPPGKRRICACLEDAELTSRLTADPYEAQVHMTPLFEIRAETLQDYLNSYKPRFSRIIGFRPSGWNYKPPNSRFVESPAVQTVLQSSNWKSSYSMADLVPQRGSTREASCFGVPYSEHSSFRELTIFCCALRIDKIIPTVNVGSAKSREKMKAWFEKWAMEKKKHGVYEIADGVEEW